ncbi:hypothetical protein GLOIN_2v1472705 [Rhizophagus irregularis DAOM 181602=DAOM 197198]|nr:hypothetical protein RhiirB3_441751 [Rhizophagus irregularis]GET53415.1 hypothetical protein GLOIN_2v1472705 [Rhizophagus irregularis DAOM 181602=DAOM 197198]CAG8747635.1 3433_t:CDS:2 [Rhizophagus irregularis]
MFYTSPIREMVNKKDHFGFTISMAKTSVQIAVAEGLQPPISQKADPKRLKASVEDNTNQ